jgi:hypothetical protein
MEGQGIARDTHCPLCKDADSIGHILGSCTHSEVKKVYIFRHDKAMNFVSVAPSSCLGMTASRSHGCRYCRIVAADLLAHLFSNQQDGKKTVPPSGMYESLLALLCLQEMRGEEVKIGSCVAHVAYERSHDVIVMKGYPFLRAKVVAANALGVMMAHDLGAPAIAAANLELLGTQLRSMLCLGSEYVRLVAIAAIIDVAQTSEAARESLAQVCK